MNFYAYEEPRKNVKIQMNFERFAFRVLRSIFTSNYR